MWAQRSGTLYARPTQAVYKFEHDDPDELADLINQYVERYCVQIVNVSYAVARQIHYALVTFEAETPGATRS